MFLLLAVSILLSCSREEPGFKAEGETEEEAYEPIREYFQLQVGNYWVYESYSVNLETGEEAPLFKRDSIYVLKDTLIGRSEYFILTGSRLGRAYRSLLRCSGPDVMDAEGRLLFSTTFIGDTIPLPASLLADEAESGVVSASFIEGVKVPYGTFDAVSYRRTFQLSTAEGSRGGGDVRHCSDYFAKGIGLIKYTSFFPNQPLDIEMRLVRCWVQ
ncbi:MAG: hypothetical protein J5I94_15845 [Phaeodactylibacter sp.]|nr:hypothetical protein [Phaeodactylibacter sp.]